MTMESCQNKDIFTIRRKPVQDVNKSQNSGILLINTGSPASCAPKDVHRYLIQFLLDPRVIDLPTPLRQLLIRAVIVPFRYKKSAASYAKIWTEEGSPLLVNSKNCTKALQEALPPSLHVALGMRYGSPSINDGLEKLRAANVRTITIVPLFPQHASATTSSVIEETMRIIGKWPIIPNVRFISEFASHPAFLDAWAEVARPIDFTQYDHVLFSFHGLPERHIKKAARFANASWCYRSQCQATAKGIAKRLSLQDYSICFQSRLGVDAWLKPYTAVTIEELAKKGCKKLCVFAPSFVADCLETIYEIGMEYQEAFEYLGGEKIDLVPSLNSHPAWIQALTTIIGANQC